MNGRIHDRSNAGDPSHLAPHSVTVPREQAVRRRLRAGRVELELDGVDLRGITVDGTEVAQQIYVAIRDESWNTVPGSVEDLSIEEGGDSFKVTFTSHHEQAGSGFEWTGRIRGSVDGTLEYTLDGRALRVLTYRRLGFNVVHGAAAFRDRPYRASLGDDIAAGRLPDLVGPQLMRDGRELGLFPPFEHLELAPHPEVLITFDFSGDEFEMEDQRNYGDGSFKTYSTPLQRAGPFQLAPGQTFSQSVRVAVVDHRPVPTSAGETHDRVIRLGPSTRRRLLPLGLARAPTVDPLSDREIPQVLALRPSHLQVELDATDGLGRFDHMRAAAAADARQLDVDLWVELRGAPPSEPGMRDVVRRILSTDPRPRRLLLHSPSMEPLDAGASADALRIARAVVEQAGAAVQVGVATDFLAELLTAPFDAQIVGQAAFGLSPTVHRSDERTIMENLVGLDSEITSARRALGGGLLFVGPIGLATRHGPYPDGALRADGLHPSSDPRQASMMAAAWTLGCVSALAGSDADAATLFETKGWRGTFGGGVAADHDGVASPPQGAFPLWHILATAAEMRDADIVTVVEQPVDVATMGWTHAMGTLLLVASTASVPTEVRVDGLPPGRPRLERLVASASSPLTATDDAAWSDEATQVADGPLRLRLDPYDIIRIEVVACT